MRYQIFPWAGGVCIVAQDAAGKELDREVIRKHPFLLVFRCRLAFRRLMVRHRKLIRAQKIADRKNSHR